MKSSSVKVLAAVGAVALIAALAFWFQPWRIWAESELFEPLPTAATSQPAELEPTQLESPTGENIASSEAEAEAVTASPAAEPQILLTGSLISHEHETSGLVQIIQLADGSRVLRLEGLETSDGPDLEVWLSDAPVVSGFDGWFLADDGNYLSLGKLKATSGDHNYEIPAEVDLSTFSSMSIWCVRFAVSFGAAELAA